MKTDDYAVARRAVRPVVAFAASCALMVSMVSACGKGEKGTPADTGANAPPPASASSTSAAAGAPSPGTAASASSTSTAGKAPSAGAAAANLPPGVTPQMVAEGDSIFHGKKAGGLCYTCHGPDAKGTPIGPPLTDHKWITGDGSYQFLVKRITEGVPQPTPPYTAPMPPMGGAPLTPEQVRAVAAYVYSISHRGGKPAA